MQTLEQTVRQVAEDTAYMRGKFELLEKQTIKNTEEIGELRQEMGKVKMVGRGFLASVPVVGATLLAFWKGELRW